MKDEINKRVAANYHLMHGTNQYIKVVEIIDRQEQKGLDTYGTTIIDYNGSPKEHIKHALEEAVDLAVYLEKLLYLLEIDPNYSDLPEIRVLSGTLRSDKSDIYDKINVLVSALNTA